MENTERTDDGTIRKTTERDRTDGNSHRIHGNGREQEGMSWESRRMMEKVRENTVHDNVCICKVYDLFKKISEILTRNP